MCIFRHPEKLKNTVNPGKRIVESIQGKIYIIYVNLYILLGHVQKIYMHDHPEKEEYKSYDQDVENDAHIHADTCAHTCKYVMFQNTCTE